MDVFLFNKAAKKARKALSTPSPSCHGQKGWAWRVNWATSCRLESEGASLSAVILKWKACFEGDPVNGLQVCRKGELGHCYTVTKYVERLVCSRSLY